MRAAGATAKLYEPNAQRRSLVIKHLRRLRPSPAMVVASLALLVALAGTSVAAVQAVVPRNSIGALQLKEQQRRCTRAQGQFGQLVEGPEPLAAQGRLQGGPDSRRPARPSRHRRSCGPCRSGRARRPGRYVRGRRARVRRRGADGNRGEGRRDQLDLVLRDRRGEAERDRPEQRDGQAARLLQRRVRVLWRAARERTAWCGSPSTTTRSRPRRDKDSSFDSNVPSGEAKRCRTARPSTGSCGSARRSSAGAHTVKVELATSSVQRRSSGTTTGHWWSQRIRVT